MLEVSDLGKVFRTRKSGGKSKKPLESDPRQEGKRFYAVRDVSFRVGRGAILGLLGPNGAGKTTLLRVLSTALKPTSGTAILDGLDIQKNPLAVRHKIGFLSGNTGLYGRLTAVEMLRYYGRLHGIERRRLAERLDELVELLDMGEFADKRNSTLSGGMRQKVSIARTLLHDPDILIFDEPTTGLDVPSAETILQLIERCKNEGKTVIFSTHNMHEVGRLADSIVLLDRGRACFEGTVEAMRSHATDGDLAKAFMTLTARNGGDHVA